MLRRIWKQLVASLLIAVFFLWLTVKQMVADAGAQTEGDFWGSLSSSIASVPLGTLALYCSLFLVVHVVRLWRWKYLINPLGEKDWRKIFRIGAVGFAAIVIMPLRLGEMVRPYLLSRESSVSMSAALGTAVVERVLDGLLISCLLFLSLATYHGDRSTGFVNGTAIIAFAVFAGALLLLVLAAARYDWTVKMMRATIGRVSERFCTAVLHLVDGFLDGVRVLRGSGVLLRFFVVTFFYWGVNGLGIMILARGFGFDITLWQGYALLAILVIGIMIPAGPGFFGNFQFFLGQGLLLFVPTVTVGAGLAFGLVLNSAQFVIQVGFALPFLIVSQVGLAKMMEANDWREGEAVEPSVDSATDR